MSQKDNIWTNICTLMSLQPNGNICNLTTVHVYWCSLCNSNNVVYGDIFLRHVVYLMLRSLITIDALFEIVKLVVKLSWSYHILSGRNRSWSHSINRVYRFLLLHFSMINTIIRRWIVNPDHRIKSRQIVLYSDKSYLLVLPYRGDLMKQNSVSCYYVLWSQG